MLLPLLLPLLLATPSSDLAGLLGAWGTADATYDLNADGVVNSADVALLLGSWETVKPPGVAVRNGDWLECHTPDGSTVVFRVSDIRAVYEERLGCRLVVGGDACATVQSVDAPLAVVMAAIRE